MGFDVDDDNDFGFDDDREPDFDRDDLSLRNGSSREGVEQGQLIQLSIQYLDIGGQFIDPPVPPTITIVDPTNAILLTANTTSGVKREDRGLFFYNFMVPSKAKLGVWQDIWSTTVNNAPFNKNLTFTVIALTSPVTAQAGPEIDPLLSPVATRNVLDLMKLLRTRLGSDGIRRKRDQFGRYLLDASGNFILEPCNVFTTDELYTFLKASLSEFNSIPHFTDFHFHDSHFVKTFKHELTEGAFILAMALQGLREKGREFQMTDDGLSYQPPLIADFLKGYLADFMNSYRERIKFIKASMKPNPQSFGTVYSLAGGGVSPAFVRLRHLRSRQII